MPRARPQAASAPRSPRPPGRVRRRVGPEQEGARRVVGRDGVEVEPSEPPRARPGPGRRGTRPAPPPWRRSGRTRRGTAPCPCRACADGAGAAPRRRTPSCRRRRPAPADRPRARSAAPATRPPPRAAAGFPPRRDSPVRSPTTPAPRSTAGSGGSWGVPMEQSTMPPSWASATLARPSEPVVGIGRQPERHGAATNSAKRARPTSSSTTCNVADSSPSLCPTTSPSR